MGIRSAVEGAFEQLLDLIAPPRERERRVRELTFEELREIGRRHREPHYAAEIKTLLPYRHAAVRALVLEMKYRRNARAFQFAAELIAEELLDLCEDSIGTPLFIPTPMHAGRRRVRGYNQTELLAEKIVAEMQPPPFEYAPHALMRTRYGLPQQRLPRALRLMNMRRAMQTNERAVRGRVCIVLDDVTTTGATLMECKRALLKAGARNVYLLALAR